MALLKKQPRAIKKVLLSIRIHPDTAEHLARYCEFLQSGAHHVVEQALEYAFRKDKELQPWLERNPNRACAGTTADGNLRRPLANDMEGYALAYGIASLLNNLVGPRQRPVTAAGPHPCEVSSSSCATRRSMTT